jgi:hypothetical protein
VKTIFEIAEILHLPGKGLVIGGVNPELNNLTPIEFENLIGREVYLLSANRQLSVSVLGTQVHAGFSGGKNFFVLLPAASDSQFAKVGNIAAKP